MITKITYLVSADLPLTSSKIPLTYMLKKIIVQNQSDDFKAIFPLTYR